jgi:hypothetical protein
MNLTFMQLIELQVAAERRIDVLEKRTFGRSEDELPYSHKALRDMRGALVQLDIGIRLGANVL